MTPVIRVLVVEDSPDVADSMRMMMSTDHGMECVGLASSADGLTARLHETPADIVILDYRMSGMDPIAAVRELASEVPEARAIFFSGFDDSIYIERAIDAGAWGWVSKAGDPQLLLDAIHAVAAGKVVFPRRRGQPGGRSGRSFSSSRG